MSTIAIVQLALFIVVLLALVKPLGWYMAQVYEGKPCGLDKAFGWLERLIYKLCRVDPKQEMSWKTYALAMLAFNFVGFLAVFLMQRFQHVLPPALDRWTAGDFSASQSVSQTTRDARGTAPASD